MTSPLYFDAVKIDPPKNKILEFNAALQAQGFAGVLDEKDLAYFESLCKVLSQPQFFHSSEIDERWIAVLNKTLEFPLDKVFPALDLFRIFLCHNKASFCFNQSDGGAYYLGICLALLQQP